jgi:acyl-CoA synthetase (AMP-forming)/AMP-acid ligase II
MPERTKYFSLMKNQSWTVIVNKEERGTMFFNLFQYNPFLKKEILPWIKTYKEFGIPKTCFPYPDLPVNAMLERASELYPDNGLIQFNEKISYKKVNDHANRMANFFLSMGLEKGDRVATILPTSVQFVIADYAIAIAGLVHIPCTSLESKDNLVHKFEHGRPEILICTDDLLQLATDLSHQTSIQIIVSANLYDYTSTPQENQDDSIECKKWRNIINDYSPTIPNIEINVDSELETLLFTGGTTGLPKGCMLTHRNIYANCIQSLAALGNLTQIFDGAITVLLALPFSHSYGHIAMHTCTLAGYNQILIPDARDTSAMVDMIQSFKPLLQIGVPTQYMNLVKAELTDMGMICLSGSAPLPSDTQETFEQVTGGMLMDAYGLSEMSPGTHLNPNAILRLIGGKFQAQLGQMLIGYQSTIWALNKMIRFFDTNQIGSIGSKLILLMLKWQKKKKSKGKSSIGIPFPDTLIKVIDADTSKPLTWDELISGKRGEMCMKGPQRMIGYWPILGSGLDREGYVHTGDIVEMDENGFFSIVDRSKDMIVVSGFKVYSQEIDDILHDHPAIERAATVGIPDPSRQGSEIVVVYIKCHPSRKDACSDDDIRAYLKTRVAKYAMPKMIKFVDHIPLTEVQKVDKKKLRELS